VSRELRELRLRVRNVTRTALARPEFAKYPAHLNFSSGHSPEFSHLLAEEGFVGMSIPVEYGGHGRPPIERYVVAEELLRLGAPVAAHWIADRQTAKQIEIFGTDEQKSRFLPSIARGECFFSVGMSEPEAGSDLAGIRTSARRVDGGWVVSGEKLWTSHAHVNHYVLLLCRTSPIEVDRHDGMSQFIVPLDSPGLEVQPIRLLDGSQHFNQVVLNDVFVPDELVLGTIGGGWAQVTSELTSERTGPDRYLSSYRVLEAYLAEHRREADDVAQQTVGELIAHVWAIRQASRSIVADGDAGARTRAVSAALAKDLGTSFEQRLVQMLSSLNDEGLRVDHPSTFVSLLSQGAMIAPSFSIRGGTREVLRIVAFRGLEVS
jgi:alkylation response protein AidB-like acyl-CoA dehydrogenase